MIFKDSISVYVSYNIDIPISWHVAHQEWQDQVMEANFVRTIILFSSDCARILFEVFTFGQAIRSKPLNGVQVDAGWLLPPIRGKASKLSWWQIPCYMVKAWKNTNARFSVRLLHCNKAMAYEVYFLSYVDVDIQNAESNLCICSPHTSMITLLAVISSLLWLLNQILWLHPLPRASHLDLAFSPHVSLPICHIPSRKF